MPHTANDDSNRLHDVSDMAHGTAAVAEPSADRAIVSCASPVAMAPKVMKKPAAQRCVQRGADTGKLSKLVQGVHGALKLSFKAQKAAVFISICWGAHIVQEIFACEDTLWDDMATVLQDSKLWDPKGVTKAFSPDRVVTQVLPSTAKHSVPDWKNKQAKNTKRTLKDVGVLNGCILTVTVGRP